MDNDIERIYLEYYYGLYKYLLKLCSNEDVAADILQNTFVQAMKSIDSFKGKSSFKTWLYSIARHEYFGYLRKNKLTVDIDSLQDDSLSIEYNLTDKLIADEISANISELGPPMNHILKLRLNFGLSFKEIGKIVGRSENYCRVNFYRVKEKLRKEHNYE